MDPPKKQQQPTAAASPEKPTSTLLDAYEVECIRRELESLLLEQNAGEGGAEASSSLEAAAEMLGLPRRRHSRRKTASAKNTKRGQASAPPKKLSGAGTRLHLGKHAVKICGGAVAVPVSSAGANGRRPRRAGYREVEKV